MKALLLLNDRRRRGSRARDSEYEEKQRGRVFFCEKESEKLFCVQEEGFLKFFERTRETSIVKRGLPYQFLLLVLLPKSSFMAHERKKVLRIVVIIIITKKTNTTHRKREQLLTTTTRKNALCISLSLLTSRILSQKKSLTTKESLSEKKKKKYSRWRATHRIRTSRDVTKS